MPPYQPTFRQATQRKQKKKESTIPCKHWRAGYCARGRDCFFYHAKRQEKKEERSDGMGRKSRRKFKYAPEVQHRVTLPSSDGSSSQISVVQTMRSDGRAMQTMFLGAPGTQSATDTGIDIDDETRRLAKLRINRPTERAADLFADSRSTRPSVQSELRRGQCPFFLTTECRFGSRCRHAHVFPDLECTFCGQELPNAAEEHRRHKRECEVANRRSLSQPVIHECGICLDDVTTRYGLLLNCDHIFCLACIRRWRSKRARSAAEEVHLGCPLCREPSHFVVPSTRFVTDAEKERVVDEYKAALGRIPCRHYAETGECPFGTSCFYRHGLEDEVLEHRLAQMRVNADKDSSLADFIFS
ncbi:MAG: hypothetical protein MHM6MM_001340 [Cercozoa sp. M6MM]